MFGFLDLSRFRRSSARTITRRARLVLMATALGAALVCVAPLPEAQAKPKVHIVYKGQRLGSIAKRYNVTVDELCRANNIKRTDPIHPGDKLVIPGTDDGKSSGKSSSKSDDDSGPDRPQGRALVHVVAKGHTLSAIAGRYAVTISAICNANGISRDKALEVGERLIIPHKTDKNGEWARKQRLAGRYDNKLDDNDDDDSSSSKQSEEETWKKYVKPAWRRGYIQIRRYGRSWKGYVIGPENQVLGHASNKINYVMGAKEDGPRIDPKLIRLLASISDKFGGREIRIVSGYRTKSFVAASKHKEGRAIDFSIPGIPNSVLRDYLRTIDGVGVGYYPNSSFVHLDVRGYNSYWVDYAGPGEAPRKAPGKKSAKKTPKGDEHEHHEDEDEGADEHEHHEEDAPPSDPESGDSGADKKNAGE